MKKRDPGLKGRIDSVERLLALETRSRVLDLSCGIGRHTLELARRGHRVLGIDLDDQALAEARETARGERLNVHFLKIDGRQVPYRAEFDAVMALAGGFSGYAGERDDLRALEAAFKALKPGGRLLLDLLNREWMMRHFEEHAREGFSFDLETGRLEHPRPSRVYALTEIKSLLSRAGFAYRFTLGGFDGSAYGIDSPRMIVLAEKPAERRAPVHPDEHLPSAIRIKGRRR